MMNFADRLTEKIEVLSNPTVMGLDPKLEFIPEEIMNRHIRLTGDPSAAAAEAIYEFNVKLIDAVYPIIPAIKPQFAYYEMYGIHGLETLYKTILYAKSKGIKFPLAIVLVLVLSHSLLQQCKCFSIIGNHIC